MAHTFDTSLYFGGNASTYTQAYTCGAGSTLLTMSIGVRSTTDRAGGSPTYGGVPMIQVEKTRKHTTSPEGITELWYTVNPSAGAQNLFIPNSGIPQIFMNVASFKAAAGKTTVFDVSIGGNGATANPTLTLTMTADGVVVSGYASGSATVATVCSPGKLLQSVLHTAMTTGGQYWFPTSTGDASMWYTIGADDWGMVAGAWKEYSVPAGDTSYGGILKEYNGSAWVECPSSKFKFYNGSTWTVCPSTNFKVYKNSSWMPVRFQG